MPRQLRVRDSVRTDARRGGAVLRYHTWPTLQRQTVAEHSWNMVRILVAIWEQAPAEAILYAEFHDTPEVACGDPPYPVKAENPDLKAGFDRVEEEAAVDMGIAQFLRPDEFWRRRVKLCDVIEMWEFGLDERAMGNGFAQPIVDGMGYLLDELIRQYRLSVGEEEMIMRYVAERRERMTF